MAATIPYPPAHLEHYPMYTLESSDEKQETLVVVPQAGNSNSNRETISYGDIIAILDTSSTTSGASSDTQDKQSPRYCMLCISFSPSPTPNGSNSDQQSQQQDSAPNPSPFSLHHLTFHSLPPHLLASYHIPHLPAHLSLSPPNRSPHSPLTDKLTILISTHSGTHLAAPFFHSILAPTLSALGLHESTHYTTLFTSSPSSVPDFTTQTLLPQALKRVRQTVILLSGDGGMVDVLNGLFSPPRFAHVKKGSGRGYVKPTIGLLVFGTGNALANSSGLNKGHTRGLRALLRGRGRSVPTFKVTFSPGAVLLVDEGRGTEEIPTDDDDDGEGKGVVRGAVVASWGLHASLVAESDTAAYRRYGSERFAMAAGELLDPADGSESHRYRGRITTFCKGKDGGEVARVWERREHMYVLVTMVSNMEAGLRISPESKMLDGQLRVVSWKPLGSGEVKRIFGMAFDNGKHVGHDDVEYEAVEGVRIEIEEAEERWRRVCVDGKIVRVPEGGWVEVRREGTEVVDLVVEE